MKKLVNFLYRIGLFSLNEKSLERNYKRANFKLLINALSDSFYLHRFKAVQLLAKTNQIEFSKYLLPLIDDSSKKVSLEAISALQQFDLPKEDQLKIKNKINFLSQLEDELENKNIIKRKKDNSYNWERPSNETFKNVKKMLKKPMIGGKWFHY